MELNADFKLRVVIHSDRTEWVASPMPGVDRRMLDRIGDEVARATSIVRYAPNNKFTAHTHTGGEEFIVLEGVFQDEHGDYPTGTYARNPPTTSHTPRSDDGEALGKGTWLRLPEGAPLNVTAGPDGAKVWIKTGHLPHATAPLV